MGRGALLLSRLPSATPCIENLDIATATFRNNVYTYFMYEHGAHKPKLASRPEIKNTTVRTMRKQLKALKASCASVNIIRRVSGSLRLALNSKAKVNNDFTRQHSFEYKSNPWKFMNQFNINVSTPPTFDNIICYTYLKKHILCAAPKPGIFKTRLDALIALHPSPSFTYE